MIVLIEKGNGSLVSYIDQMFYDILKLMIEKRSEKKSHFLKIDKGRDPKSGPGGGKISVLTPFNPYTPFFAAPFSKFLKISSFRVNSFCT